MQLYSSAQFGVGYYVLIILGVLINFILGKKHPLILHKNKHLLIKHSDDMKSSETPHPAGQHSYTNRQLVKYYLNKLYRERSNIDWKVKF